MDIINAEVMDSLVRHSSEHCVSLYLPTHRLSQETQEDRIRMRNLLDEARRELEATGMRRSGCEALLQPARRLGERSSFWQRQEDGLAVFLAADRLETFRVPISFEPFVAVSDAFHVKPLWRVVAGDLFYVLSLSRNHVRLFWADRFQIGDVDLPEDIPTSLAEALWFDDPEKQLQHHAANRADRGRVIAEFHGHGAGAERDLSKLEMFLRAVDGGVRGLVDPDTPLVLAGVKELTARYRQVSRHGRIVQQTVPGNHEASRPGELHAAANALVKPVLDRSIAEDAQRFHAAGDHALATIPETVAAARSGRVATLFLPVGVHAWGTTSDDGGEVTMHEQKQPGDRDLLDVAGVATWSAGGKVHALEPAEIPGGGVVAAVLRY